MDALDEVMAGTRGALSMKGKEEKAKVIREVFVRGMSTVAARGRVKWD